MTERPTVLCKDDRSVKGSLCAVCTGCGRCVGVHIAPEVVTKLHLPAILMENEDGRRLVAVDIGTTTIAMQLYREDGSVAEEHVSENPQRKYGADVLSRIQAAEDPAAASAMKEAVTEILSEGFARFRARIDAKEQLFAVIACNTAMRYLLLEYDPAELGKAPFHVSHPGGEEVIICGVRSVVLPSFAAFVGGDIAAGVLACELAEREEITLLVDLGTNGEMVLGNRKKILACATAAGPAFEGGPCAGIWGADLVKLVAELRRADILDETGLMADPYFDEGVLVGNVRVNVRAVRALQLAKGAVAAGIEILTRRYGITFEQIDRVVLAGGFGYFLDPADAACIGLLPEELTEKCVSGGNTSLAGAVKYGAMALKGERYSFPEVTVINLAEEPDFEEIFLERLNLKPERAG